MIITLEMLEEKNACGEQVELFKAVFGERANVTPKNCLLAYEKGLDLQWAVGNLLTKTAWAVHRRTVKTAREEYLTATRAAWQEYCSTLEAAGEDYDRALGPAREEHRRTVKTAWAEYHRLLWLSFYDAVSRSEEERRETTND